MFNYFNNMQSNYFKKIMFDVLKERYQKNESIVERLGVTLVTESDLNSFLKMVGDIYESAYMKAVDDHKEQLQKAGLVANIVSANQSSKDG